MFVGVVLVGLLIAWLFRSDQVETAEVGGPAPDFTVDLLDGGTFNLSAHLSNNQQPVVLNLWASWCIPCRTEMPDLDQFAAENPDWLVLGVAVQDRLPRALEFAAEVDVDYPLAFANDGFDRSYPRIALPVTFVIAADGTVTDLHNGILNVADLERLTGS